MEQLSVAIADDNERLLDMLDEIISSDKMLNVVGKAKNGEDICQIIRNKAAGCGAVGSDYAENGWSDSDGSDQSGQNGDRNIRDFIVLTASRTGSGLLKMPFRKVQITT